jgi:hypothetical protein
MMLTPSGYKSFSAHARLALAIFMTGLLIAPSLTSQRPAPKPLFRDPVHDGAADPVLIWNRVSRK